MATLSRKELEDIEPHVDKTVQKFLGFSEPSLVTTALNCLLSGYDKIKTAKTLGALLDESKALKLADKIFEIAENARNNSKSRKRPRDAVEAKHEEPQKKPKQNEENNTNSNANAQTLPGQLTANQV